MRCVSSSFIGFARSELLRRGRPHRRGLGARPRHGPLGGQGKGRGGAFLRFCHVTGRTARPLADAVPKVASWRLAGLPKAVDTETVRALLQSCDRRTAYGRRDFAVLMLLSRLGLRSGEVASLCLEDIDWRAGELDVSGKGSKLERLPLPAEVGEAIAGWLRRGRPDCVDRQVITRVRAPHGVLSSGGIYAIVHAACVRAGIPNVHPHRLRPWPPRCCDRGPASPRLGRSSDTI